MRKIILFVFIALLLSGCTQPQTKAFLFTEEEMTLEVDDQDLLPLQLEHLELDDLIFSLSNNDIISIDNYIITALQVGETILTVRHIEDESKSISIHIIVTPKLPRLYAVMDGITVDQTVKIDILNFTNYDDFVWIIDNPTILSINHLYTARGLAIGVATVTVTHIDNAAITSSITIEVLPATPNLTAANELIKVGDEIEMMVLNTNGYAMEDFTWEVDDSTVISLSDTYIVTGLKQGQATITITFLENTRITATHTILVSTPSTEVNALGEPSEGPLFLTAENRTATVQAGETIDIDIFGMVSKQNYRWHSSDASIVAATDMGIVHGIKEGRAILLAVSKLDNSITGQIIVTVVGTPRVNYIERLLQAANNEIGYREGPNNNNKYGDWFGFNNVAWCAIFVSWSANQAGIGIDVIPKYSSVSFGMMWYQMQKRFEYKEDYIPKAGDIIFFKSAGASHTGIVTSSDGIRVYTVEGNTSNQVAARSYLLDHDTITGYGLPDYPPFLG